MSKVLIPVGNVSIFYYSNDTSGNIAYIYVLIIKILLENELDTTTIIIIVIGFLLGTVAIVVVVYTKLKKQESRD